MATSILARIALLVVADRMGAEAVAQMRREEPERKDVLLSASGEARTVNAHGKIQDIPRLTGESGFCNADFPLGADLTGTTGTLIRDDLDPTYCAVGFETVVNNFEDCKFAAIQANLKWPTAIDISSNLTERVIHPKKCFLADCPPEVLANLSLPANAAGYPCYYWNGFEGDMVDANNTRLTIVKGQAVCRRDKFKEGTEHKNPSEGCPVGYTEIQDMGVCEDAAPCIGVTESDVSEIHASDVNKYNKYPVYCFTGYESTSQRSRKGYYNRPIEGVTAEPTNPGNGACAYDFVGDCVSKPNRPLCNVSSVTHFPDGNYPNTPIKLHPSVPLTR